MSHTDLVNTMVRINYAKRESPIAVFLGDKKGKVDCYFAAVTAIQARIERGDPTLIGIFCKEDCPEYVASVIRRYC